MTYLALGGKLASFEDKEHASSLSGGERETIPEALTGRANEGQVAQACAVGMHRWAWQRRWRGTR